MLLHRICSTLTSALIRLLMFRNPLTPFRRLGTAISAGNPRGMHRWYDLVDWVGGWPFEVARPEEVLDFYRSRAFELVRLKTVLGNQGCNEFVFRQQGEEM